MRQNRKKSIPDDLTRKHQPRQFQLLRRHRESNSMLAIVLAGIAGLFILTIVAAYNYASRPSVAVNTAVQPTAGLAADTGSTAQPSTMRAETTGTGSSVREPAAEPGQRDNPPARKD